MSSLLLDAIQCSEMHGILYKDLFKLIHDYVYIDPLSRANVHMISVGKVCEIYDLWKRTMQVICVCNKESKTYCYCCVCLRENEFRSDMLQGLCDKDREILLQVLSDDLQNNEQVTMPLILDDWNGVIVMPKSLQNKVDVPIMVCKVESMYADSARFAENNELPKELQRKINRNTHITLKRGDLISLMVPDDIVINKEYDYYRNDDLYIYDGKTICDLASEPDEYGSVPDSFLVPTEFPPNYWHLCKPRSIVHNDWVPVQPLSQIVSNIVEQLEANECYDKKFGDTYWHTSFIVDGVRYYLLSTWDNLIEEKHKFKDRIKRLVKKGEYLGLATIREIPISADLDTNIIERILVFEDEMEDSETSSNDDIGIMEEGETSSGEE